MTMDLKESLKRLKVSDSVSEAILKLCKSSDELATVLGDLLAEIGGNSFESEHGEPMKKRKISESSSLPSLAQIKKSDPTRLIFRNISFIPRKTADLYVGNNSMCIHTEKDGVLQYFKDLECVSGLIVPMPSESGDKNSCFFALYSLQVQAARHPESIFTPFLCFKAITAESSSPKDALVVELPYFRKPPTSYSGKAVQHTICSLLSGCFTIEWSMPPSHFEFQWANSFGVSQPACYFACKRRVQDSFVYPLDKGILIGFGKPIMFIPYSHLISLRFSDIVRSSFTAEITVKTLDSKLELNQINHAQYEPLANYFSKHFPSWKMAKDGTLCAPAEPAADSKDSAASSDSSDSAAEQSDSQTSSEDEEYEESDDESEQSESLPASVEHASAAKKSVVLEDEEDIGSEDTESDEELDEEDEEEDDDESDLEEDSEDASD